MENLDWTPRKQVHDYGNEELKRTIYWDSKMMFTFEYVIS